MKTTKLIAVFLFAAVALSVAYAQGKAKGAPNKAQGAKSPPTLSSFCGFKAGEEMQAAKKRSKLKYGDMEVYWARKPFRKFKDVTLEYVDTGHLISIQAIARMPKMNLAAARKELESCCKELSKSGVAFDKEWDGQGGVFINKHGRGRGVDDMMVSGQIDPENAQGVIMQIMIAWNLRFFLQPTLKVNPAKYKPESELTRKEFVENVFGLKFGENVFDTIKRGPLDFKDSDALVSRILSAPVCGIDEAGMFQGEENKLALVSLCRSSYDPPVEKNVAAAKARCDKELASVADWLGLAPKDFQTTEKTEDKGGKANAFGVVAPASKETTLKSEYFKDGFQIEVHCGWAEMKDSGEILFTLPSIYFRNLSGQSPD